MAQKPKQSADVSGVYLTTAEAATYLKLSRQSLEAARYRADGSGPPYIKLTRSVRYRRSTLDAWMSAHDHPPDKPCNHVHSGVQADESHAQSGPQQTHLTRRTTGTRK
jgi:predicted DNA-binding transcriptional regulator AlpA